LYGHNKEQRACIVTSKNLPVWAMKEFTHRDMTTISLRIKDRMCTFSSVYMDGNEKKKIDKKLDDLTTQCHNNKTPMLIGTDSNAHSELWGCKDCDERGKLVEHFIFQHDLELMNEGSVPTFHNTSDHKSMIDLTLVNR
jgi:hypothetical protein